jgi:hypothetical protein
MNAFCRAYDSTTAADAAVETLVSAGVPGDDVRLLMGAELHDARAVKAGGFAGAVAPTAEVGSYAGAGNDRSTHAGSFGGATAAATEGVFANADRDIVVTGFGGREQARVAGHHKLKQLLVEAGLDDATAERDVEALHEGRVLVLVSLGAVGAERVGELLDVPA